MSERRRTADSEPDARTFDFSEVPLGGHLPEGSYDMKIASCEQRYSQEKGLLMYTVEFRVMQPEAMFGRGHYETLIFGTTPFDPGDSKNPDFIAYAQINDPEAEDPLTLKMSRGVQTFKQILHYAGVDMEQEIYMPDLITLCNGGELMVGMRIRVEEQKDGRYAGTIRNRIGHIYEVGREEAGFTANPTSGRRSARQSQTGAPEGRRRATQPDNMQRAMASSRTREQISQDLEEDGVNAQLDAPVPPVAAAGEID